MSVVDDLKPQAVWKYFEEISQIPRCSKHEDKIRQYLIDFAKNHKFESKTDKDGNVLPDCFLVPKGTNALEFAYKVHTDIGDNFVKAINLKTKQPVAKDAPLNNNDVVEIMTSK